MHKLVQWWDRRRRTQALKKINKLRRFTEPIGDMRQFLYLDAVALRSLYVSRYGPESARITISNARTRDAELDGSFGYSLPSLGSANGSALLRSSIANSAQIERISSEQSLFKDFIERESIAGKHSKLWNGTQDSSGHFPPSSKALQRGDLIQVQIKLRADNTYRISSFASSLATLAESASSLQLNGTSQMLEVADVLRHLLIDQAPIDAELTDWGWNTDGNKLAHKGENTEPIHLVGLTEIDNYWIDVRRALFDGAECTALVRVSQDVPSNDWSPLKLFDAVKDIPGLEALDDSIRHATSSFNADVNEFSPSENPLSAALTHYARERSSEGVPEIVYKQLPRIAAHYYTPHLKVTSASKAFDEVDELLAAVGHPDQQPDNIAVIRSSSVAIIDKHSSEFEGGKNYPTSAQSEVHYLTGEVIALYW